VGRRRQAANRPARGFTLIEVIIVLAVMGILIAAVVPSHQASLQRARRLDAVAALQRMQAAQEEYRARWGLYGAERAALSGIGPFSAEGLYALSVRDADGEHVTLAALARADHAQRGDGDCREITLRLNQGFAEPGPSGRCWNF
jgi:type IV pilus assembly protein PilE